MKIFIQIIFAVALIGSVSSCKQDKAKNKAEVAAKEEVKEVLGASDYGVNASESLITWEGAKPTGKHAGTIALSNGSVKVENGEVVGGSFEIDMNSIICTDLEGEKKANLEGHLKSADFFDVAVHPKANFEIVKVAKLANDENASHLVYGNLTLKDVTKKIGFKASISNNNDNIKVSTPSFMINRADFNIKYGSKTFFDDLKDKFINDDMNMTINLVASK